MRSFLCFLLETTEKHNKPISVKATKDSEYIRSKLNSDLKQSVGALNIFQVSRWHTFNLFKNIKYLDDLVLHFSGLHLEEILKVVLICYNFPVFHSANVTYKLHLYN